MKRSGLFFLGAGFGLIAGAQLGRAADTAGIIAAALGLILIVFGLRRGPRDLVADATAASRQSADLDGFSSADQVGDAAAAGRPAGGAGRPATGSGAGAFSGSAAGLGSHVERVLRLAEQQAADHIAEAESKAAQIVADAQAEARRRHGD